MKEIMRQIIWRHRKVSEISRLSSTEIAGEETAFDKLLEYSYHNIKTVRETSLEI